MSRPIIWTCVVLVVALAGGWYGYEMRADQLKSEQACGKSDGRAERSDRDEISDRDERSDRAERLSLEAATVLIRAHLLAADPQILPAIDYPLEETTPDEVFAKMGVQMFKVIGAFETGQDYIVQDGQVTRIGTYWGGGGIIDVARTVKLVERDGDGGGHNNRRYELHYTYSTGSGVSILMQGVYRGPGEVAEDRIEKEGDY
jgi:hypothetical protein